MTDPRQPFSRERLVEARRASRVLADDWRGGEAYRALVARFDALADDDAEAVAQSAAVLLRDTGWVVDLLRPMIAAVRGDHAVEPPLRIVRDRLRIGAILLDHPAVSISASVVSATASAAQPPATSVVATGRLAVVRYHRAGGACWQGWDAGLVAATFTAAEAPPLRRLADRPLVDGEVVRHDGRVSAGMLAGARDDVVVLTALMRGGAAPLMREYALPRGELIRVAALGDVPSRTHMLLTLLRLSGRADAAPLFEAATRSDAFHLRWSAMREWLALDMVAALPRLAQMAAADPHPEVRAAARATLLMTRERRAA